MIKVIKWCQNYWYYYKWHTIIGAFFIFMAIFMIGQMITKDDPDITLLYSGPVSLTADQKLEIQNAAELIMTEDYNGDGEKVVMLNTIELLSDDQVADAKDRAKANGEDLYINGNAMSEARNNFTTEIFAGDSVICLLDPYWYEVVRKNDGFIELESVLGYKPSYALDDYSVRLADTDFGKYFTAFSALPEDTVLCMRRISTTIFFTGAAKGEKEYEYNCDMFQNIMNFEFPEGYVPEIVE